jgi:hypothetical protein
MYMLRVKVKEGILELDKKRMIIRHTKEAGIIENIISWISRFSKKKEDSIPLKKIRMVVFEKGVPGSICPHMLIYYKDKSRLIEFCLETKDELPRYKEVLEFLEKQGIELGMAVEGAGA